MTGAPLGALSEAFKNDVPTCLPAWESRRPRATANPSQSPWPGGLIPRDAMSLARSLPLAEAAAADVGRAIASGEQRA